VDWAFNRRSVLENMDICVSKCIPTSNDLNGTAVRSGVRWVPNGVSCDGFDPSSCS